MVGIDAINRDEATETAAYYAAADANLARIRRP